MDKKPFQNGIAVKLLIFYILLMMEAFMGHAQSGDAPSSTKSQDKILIPRGTQVVLLVTDTLSGKEGSSQPQIVVAQDVILDGVTVIASGEPVQYSIIRKAAGGFNMPGEIGFDVASVTMTSRDLIGLRSSHSVSGKPACVEYDCLLLPAFFWLKGDPGKVQGRLLIGAAITETLEVNREAFATPKQSTPSSLARIHLYQPAQTRNSWDLLEHHSGIKLDGKRIGLLADDEYACVAVDPGLHVLKIGKDDLTFAAEAGKEHYIRVAYPTQGPDDRTMKETEGYQLGSNTLRPGSFKRKEVPCFNSLGSTLDETNK
jgi:hypothetical protein